MKKKIILTENAPQPIGPYSQAVRVGELVFISGQIPIDPKTNNLPGYGVVQQTKQVLENLKAVIIAAECSLESVVKTTVYLKDMNDFKLMNDVYSEYFDAATAPARACVEVARLPKDVLLEIDAVVAI